MANAVVARMLRGGVVEGGAALTMRLGDSATRFTTDLDTARASGLDEFMDALEEALSHGWAGFTGRVATREPASPAGVPAGYVMQPFDVKLQYAGKPWVTVPLEVGHDEIGDADAPEYGLAPEVTEAFLVVGLPDPGPVPLMPLHHQVAQKLHGLSAPGSVRAHDLIGLQLIMAGPRLDLHLVRATCARLFGYRRLQEWPPVVVERDGWADLYEAQAKGLPVLGDVTEAVVWVNDLIVRIDAA